MKAEVFSGRLFGFPATGLRTTAAELVMVPTLGGRVVSLRSRRTGREWCWHRPDAEWLWANQPGDDFGRSPQAGIDECVPSVAACTWRGRAIPDHGDVWAQPWTLDPAALAQGCLSAEVALRSCPLRFGRDIRALEDGGGFAFDYTLTNLGAEVEECLWCVHPLFTIEEGDRVEMPAGVSSLRLNGGLGDRPMRFGDTWAYPEPFPGIRLDRLETPGMPKGCVKGFAGPLRKEARAALANDRTGDRLEVRWNADLNPYVGLWLNRGHGGFHHVALEPTNGAPDALPDAVAKWRQFTALAPGEVRRWTLEWRIA